MTLTNLETQTLILLARGAATRHIAASLFPSYSAAKRCIERVKNKLGITDKVKLLRYALKHGIDTIGNASQVPAAKRLTKSRRAA